ncbi:hypothetical protein CDL60_18160 [Roseateles noduli]|nr:hypothetical protein CDL60_18160 [Roseateles noduli]
MARKFIQQRQQTKEEMFDAVVRNAIDFVDASLDNLDKRPKNGIVDFYTAIELFLKARLMAEHWTLIIGKPESANLASFSVGDFHSVYLEDAARRLKDIVGEAIEETALDNFKTLAEHRNQIVHFAHTSYPDLGGSKAGVVVEQWASWRWLHELLTVRWKSTFRAYLPELDRLHRRILQEREFIQSRFQELEPIIHKKQRDGHTFVQCGSCQAASGLVSESHPWGSAYRCLVCQKTGLATKPTAEKISCDKCSKEFEFFNPALEACPHCAHPIDTDKLISLCKAKYKKGDDWWEEDAPCVAQCHECKHSKPSVFYIDGLWSCVSCFDRGWQAIACPHCDEFVTGDMETIKYFACFKCEEERRREITAAEMSE